MIVFEILSELEYRYLVLLASSMLILIAMVDAVYFYYRYQKDIDKRFSRKNGHEYIGTGLLLGLIRQGWYGGYCLSSRLAKRDGHFEFFSKLPRNQRRHLVFVFCTMMLAAVMFFGSSGVTVYLGS